jgi:sn-glycerol 3-phosphate transport system ATP-binding protein
MASLSLRGVSKRYTSGAEVLSGIDLEVEDGEFVVLVGPSGCGKSTLLRIVAGLVEASEGELLIDGRRVNELEPRERDVAMVFQNYALYPHMTVRRNLAFPLRMAGLARGKVAQRVEQVADSLGLGELLERKPAQLSGGQMQRVAVGRAIVREPKVFLFDEPLSNLDAKLRSELRRELKALHRRLGITTLYVTHDQAEAMTLGSRICVLDGGRILQVGPPLEVYTRPADRFVAGFLGAPSMNLLEGQAEAGVFRLGAIEVPGAPRDGKLTLGVRPESLVVGGQGVLLGIASVEALGHRTLLTCQVSGQELRVGLPGGGPVPEGDGIRINFPPDALHWFDPSDGVRIGG